MLTIGSLFSGIGGLELGLERAGLGPVLWQVERDTFCQRVLAKHWPTVERHEDIQTVRVSQLRAVDLICGGFPCQDVSSAGQRKGLGGARSGLWWEFARVVKEARPRFVIVENVASGATRWLCSVRSNLHQLGYRTRALGIAASDVGAPHARKRIFIVAYANKDRKHAGAKHAEVAVASSIASDVDGIAPGRTARPNRQSAWTETEPAMVRVADGLPKGLDTARKRALGNAVVPQCAQIVGEVIRQMLEAT